MTPFVYAQISILHLFCEAVVHTNIHRDTLETVLYPPRIGISELHVPSVSPSSSADRLAIALPPAEAPGHGRWNQSTTRFPPTRCIQPRSCTSAQELQLQMRRQLLWIRHAAASGPDAFTVIGIDHFSATKLIDTRRGE